MKNVFFLCLLYMCLILTGCNTSTEFTTEKPGNYDDNTKNENFDYDDFDISSLYGTWESNRGLPVVINNDGTAESPSAKLEGTYNIEGDSLKIYWSKTNRTEIWKIKNNDGKMTLEYGEEPLVAIYEKE
ncbi:MAG: hypothetical protein E7394_03480 [Ruminococcaceae bacterium]|nr:hypothetical protein [Oscillospiraceae bacterium]